MNDERRKKLDTLLSTRNVKVEVSRGLEGDLLHATITNWDGTNLLGEGYGRTSEEAVSAAMLWGRIKG